jgi:hypothetical protein
MQETFNDFLIFEIRLVRWMPKKSPAFGADSLLFVNCAPHWITTLARSNVDDAE